MSGLMSAIFHPRLDKTMIFVKMPRLVKIVVFFVAIMTGGVFVASQARSERLSQPVAVFSGLDKITGRITSFDVYIGETYQFGSLQVTPRVCYSSASGEAALTDGFVEVTEITLDRQIRKIFSGWMFADSPGLNAVENPVHDIWLKDCKAQSDIPPP